MTAEGLTALGSTLLLTLPAEPTDQQLTALQSSALEGLASDEITRLVVDASNLVSMDAFMAESLRGLSQAASLMGCRAVLAGLGPGPALVLTALGEELPDFATVREVREAIR